MATFLSKALVEATVLVASHTLAPKTFASFWKAVQPRLTEGVSYMEKHEQAGLEAERTFLEIITFRDAELDRIVNACLKEFLHSDVLVLLEQVAHIENRITERREQINAWKLASLSAPATSLMPLAKTRGLFERRIARERKAIEAEENRIAHLKAATLRRLSADGIPMTPEQLDGLLYTAEGADLARTMAVAENIKAVEAQLAALLSEPDAGPEQVKSYTGFLMMSYRVYIEAIDRALRAVEDDYLYRLGDIMNDANEQMIAADLIHQKSPERAQAALTNIDLNARTIELAELYEKHLKERLTALKALRRDMKLNFELARNTFRTVKVGAELIDVIKSSQKDLMAIFEFAPPAIDAFYDAHLRSEFDAITAQLKAKPEAGRARRGKHA